MSYCEHLTCWELACPHVSGKKKSDKTTRKTKLTVIWDFDYTMVNDNADTYLFDKLAPDIRKAMIVLGNQPEYACWTDLMHECLKLLHENGVGKEEINRCQATIPMFPEILELLSYLHRRGAVMYIVSDANSVFIDTILKARGLDEMFPPERIITNPAFWEGDRLHVRRFHKHECSRCPPNLCKGSVVRNLVNGSKRVFYVGDGTGDVCPCLSLRQEKDVAFARKGFSLARALAQAPETVRPTMFLWEDGAELYSAMLKALS